MAEVESPPLIERKSRKSVAFSESTSLINEAGDITYVPSSDEKDDKTTAESHSSTNGDAKVDDATAAFDDLALKKKKKSKKPKEGEKEGEKEEPAADAAAEVPAADAEFDPSALKKKKKKKVVKVDEAEDFEAKLAAAAALEKEGEEEPAAAEVPAKTDGDMDAGTGIWSHDSEDAINYNLLLSRFFKQLNEFNPGLMSSGTKSYKIPPPQCLREGNKKTIFANIADIAKRMKRSDEHLSQFLFAELGTTGSTDGSRRLVIKGKFLQKQIENVLRRYLLEYVVCRTCKSPDTDLVRGENRLYFINCNSCGSRRSVTTIKAGFLGQVHKRKKQQG